MDEYIEREALIKKIDEEFHKTDTCGEEQIGFLKCRRISREIPAADVAPVVHGRWDRVIPSKSAAKWSSKVSCSVCHNAGYNHFKYCPNCGAKMDEEVAE